MSDWPLIVLLFGARAPLDLTESERQMIRGVTLRGAISVNIITMIGIGPLITIPLVVAALHGGLALVGWVVGAIIALCDALVWAELSSRYPGSGGTYVYLREAFGRNDWGRLFAFLFNWQFFFSAPLLIASGYIGFAQYASYLFPALAANMNLQHFAAAGLGIVVLILLYRRVTTVTYIATGLAVAAITTLVAVIAAGAPHIHAQAFNPGPPSSFSAFMLALGTALVITLYDYGGYNSAALIGDEVVAPTRTIPQAIVASIGIIAALYILLQVSVLSVVPWQQIIAMKSQFVAASAIENVWGAPAARAVTVLILLTAFASTYGLLLGFSRIPYAAALDDEFFPVFARLHPRGRFPYVSLLVVGLLTIPACFFTLGAVISFLTAGIVLIQSIAQIVALAILRRRDGPAPFGMWLYPLPAIVALIAWIFIFYSSGNSAMLYGVLTLGGGVLAYLLTARIQRRWPFVTAVLMIAAMLVRPHAVAAAGFHSSAIVQRGGYPIFTVDGKPFFVYGASFFYERIPKRLWKPSLQEYKKLGINTIDLYLIWNWHELSDGAFDFTGRTNPRRDLHAVLQLIHTFGFHTILRPGPVIRNEWRNGGYPAWLLRRPAYNMPLHDILEGRYPATATLQNAHSDDAAAEWLANATHLRYADRWLQRVLQEVGPWSTDVIAIALDDDQGAYIDNQTWPAPHLQVYLRHLAHIVRGAVGPAMPLFINTYQMKVTPSAPAWAWGNWYQSEAYSLGEHDRSELEFSTGLLATQTHMPVMQSEFQAGWLQGPDQAYPRRVSPENTMLALHTLLQSGARGIVNFPVQDTIYPSGWEAPFANAAYAWDAALTVEGRHQARYRPTMEFGHLVLSYGGLLAQTHRVTDAAIAYTVSAYDPLIMDHTRVDDIAAATEDALRDCRQARLTCDLVDLRYTTDRALRRYPYLIVPPAGTTAPFVREVSQRLRRFRFHGKVVRSARDIHPRTRSVNISDAVLNISGGPKPFGFLDIVNYNAVARRTSPILLHFPNGETMTLPPVRLAPNSASFIPLRLPTRENFSQSSAPPQRTATKSALCRRNATVAFAGACWPLPASRVVPANSAIAYTFDVLQDGEPWLMLANQRVKVGVSPAAGARAFVFQNGNHNAFTTTGALRDDIDPAPTPSPRDYIAQYTHQFPAGTFNRPYRCRISSSGATAQANCSYSAPDLGVTFERVFLMQPNKPAFTVRFRMAAQLEKNTSGLMIDAFASSRQENTAISNGTAHILGCSKNGGQIVGCSQTVPGNSLGLYDSGTHMFSMLAWPASDPLQATVEDGVGSDIVRLKYPANTWHELSFGYYAVRSLGDAEHLYEWLRGRPFDGANGR